MRDQASNNGVVEVGVGIVVRRLAAGRLPKNGDSCRIPAESCNIVTEPLNGFSLVEKSNILGFARRAGKAEDVDTIASR